VLFIYLIDDSGPADTASIIDPVLNWRPHDFYLNLFCTRDNLFWRVCLFRRIGSANNRTNHNSVSSSSMLARRTLFLLIHFRHLY